MHGPWPDKSGTRDLPSEAKLGSHAAALPAFQPPAQGRECAIVARQLSPGLCGRITAVWRQASQRSQITSSRTMASPRQVGGRGGPQAEGDEPAPW